MTAFADRDQLLERLRTWLEEVERDVEQVSATPLEEVSTPRWRELVEQFIALRHEVKLQTKGARQLQDTGDSVVAALQQAIARLDAAERQFSQAAGEVPQRGIELLMNLDDILDRGRTAVETARERIVEHAADELAAALDARFAREPWWRRWAVAAFHCDSLALCRRQAEEAHATLLDSLVQGYRLIQSRVLKAMRDEQLERIECLGQPVDPHAMTVVEAVAVPDVSPGTVLQEIRRGYRWRGSVARFAEVRAVGFSSHAVENQLGTPTVDYPNS